MDKLSFRCLALGAAPAVAVALLASSCGGGSAPPAPDLSEQLFQADHILEVTITLDAADWAALRAEPDVIGGSRVTCDNQPLTRDYTYFSGEITVDGVTVGNVGVRKKGGFGSLSSTRPGLKIKANEFVLGQRIFGLKRLTLNNNVQDLSFISQCLGYGLFRDAGLPASRCSFAHVTVNGEDLGLYSNVETLKRNFLGRHFADNTGRLYESGGDFVTGGLGGFQPKTNKQMPDCSDLAPVATALQAPDASLVSELGSVVDLDEFIDFWAMEVITDHWDGYANNQNNYFFYHDPTSDQFHFIPWGIDALFTGRERTTRPDSVFACGSLAWRLYDVPETRDRYLTRLRTLLATVWDEAHILAEIDRMEALILPVADPSGSDGVATSIEAVRVFVRGRAAHLLAELDAGTPVWPYAAGGESCRVVVGDVSATFDTTFDTLADFGAGTATTSGTVSGVSLVSTMGSASSGFSEEGQPMVRIFGQLTDGRFAVVFVLAQNDAHFTPGTWPIDLVNITALMIFYDPATDTASGGGLVFGGTVTFTDVSTTSAAPIVGSISMGSVVEL